jgi:hypothetical protein
MTTQIETNDTRTFQIELRIANTDEWVPAMVNDVRGWRYIAERADGLSSGDFLSFEDVITARAVRDHMLQTGFSARDIRLVQVIRTVTRYVLFGPSNKEAA